MSLGMDTKPGVGSADVPSTAQSPSKVRTTPQAVVRAAEKFALRLQNRPPMTKMGKAFTHIVRLLAIIDVQSRMIAEMSEAKDGNKATEEADTQG